MAIGDEFIAMTSDLWSAAKRYFAENPNAIKISKRFAPSFKQSILKINGVLYAKGRRLGRGAYGSVKLLQSEKEHKFAVKIEQLEYCSVNYKERVALAHIGEFYGYAFRNHVKSNSIKRYSVMEYKPGKNLFDWLYIDHGPDTKLIHSHALSHYQKIIIAIKATKDLMRLHEKRIVHADLKPKNLRVYIKNGFISVAWVDFGFSLILDDDKDNIIGGCWGTNGYAAPEIPIRGGGRFSFASDVYALGYMFKHDLGIPWDGCFYMLSKEIQHRPSLDTVLKYLLHYKAQYESSNSTYSYKKEDHPNKRRQVCNL